MSLEFISRRQWAIKAIQPGTGVVSRTSSVIREFYCPGRTLRSFGLRAELFTCSVTRNSLTI